MTKLKQLKVITITEVGETYEFTITDGLGHVEFDTPLGHYRIDWQEKTLHREDK